VPDDSTQPPALPPARIRPFILTAGRVADDDSIGLETQVVAHVPGSDTMVITSTLVLTSELASILALCTEPLSVAEISALVPLHFGVARVLVNDLNTAGYVDVHLTDETMSQDPEFIKRVIRGLREI
jgi:Protein of unknown function (DUF742)